MVSGCDGEGNLFKMKHINTLQMYAWKADLMLCETLTMSTSMLTAGGFWASVM